MDVNGNVIPHKQLQALGLSFINCKECNFEEKREIACEALQE